MSEQQQQGRDDASVVLDIGGDIGALIVHTDPSMHLVEIEISPDDEAGSDVFQAEHPHEPEHTHEHSHEDGHTHSHVHHTPGTTHVAVHKREMTSGVSYAAVYPGLRQGDYTLWNADGSPAESVHIEGGTVVELDWRGR